MNRNSIIFNNIKRVLLSDCGDVTFGIFFKSYNILMNRLRMRKESLDSEVDLSKNDEFFGIMRKQFSNITKKFRYKYNISYSNIFFIKDSPSEQNWRKSIYPEYKSNRKNTKYKNRSFNLGNLFKRVYAEIYPRLVEEFNINVIQISNAEADDTISVITRQIPLNVEVYIISSDTDYLQLLNRENTYIYALNGSLINNKLNGKTAEEKLLHKVVCGDKTDNIPPCIPNSKVANNYLNNLGTLWKDLNTNQELLEKFKRNRTLIDFNYIPTNIQSRIIKSYNECLVK